MRSLLSIALLSVLLPVAALAQAPDQQPEPVILAQAYSIPSAGLKQTRRVNVYLPPGYAEGTRHYPVLYLLDGGVKEDFVHIVGIASLAADWRNIRDFIVVGIEGIDRYHDLTHPSSVARDRERLPTSGGAPAFREFLSRELKPFIARRFRVTDESVLMGESAAGLFVVETLLREPGLFQGYIAVSPMLWWDGQSLARASGELLQKPFPPGRRLYLTIADEGGEMQEGVDRLVEALRLHGPRDLRWTYVPLEHETHATTFHPAALSAVRQFFSLSDTLP